MATENWHDVKVRFDERARLVMDVDGCPETVRTYLRKHGVEGACTIIVLPKLTTCPKPVVDCGEGS